MTTKRKYGAEGKLLGATIKRDVLPDGRYISTVRLPQPGALPVFDMIESLYEAVTNSKRGGRSFETKVFPNKEDLGTELETHYYETEEEARAGHSAVIERLTKETVQ